MLCLDILQKLSILFNPFSANDYRCVCDGRLTTRIVRVLYAKINL